MTDFTTCWAGQYNVRCIKLQPGAKFSSDDLITECRKVGAIFCEDGPTDECFVVDLGRGVGPEIWTENALRRSARNTEREGRNDP